MGTKIYSGDKGNCVPHKFIYVRTKKVKGEKINVYRCEKCGAILEESAA